MDKNIIPRSLNKGINTRVEVGTKMPFLNRIFAFIVSRSTGGQTNIFFVLIYKFLKLMRITKLTKFIKLVNLKKSAEWKKFCKPQMRSEIQKYLHDLFANDTKNLEKLIKKDLSFGDNIVQYQYE